MNMHGIIEPDFGERAYKRSRARDFLAWMRTHYMFPLVVLIPTLVTIVYLFGIASDQYSSEAHFLVRSSGSGAAAASAGGLGQILNLAGGTTSDQSEAMSVSDYLSSHDAVAALRSEDKLVERFSVPEADFISRLRTTHLTPERLLKYYQNMVHVEYNAETGITVLTVRSFRPADSYELIKKLLRLGEGRVNQLNQRSYTDSIALARQQLDVSEQALGAVQVQMTSYRQKSSDIDPTATGQSQIGLVRALTERLATARAELNTMRQAVNANSPQLRAMESSVRSLEAQTAQQSSRLTGGDTAIAADIGGYEKLKLRQEFLAKRYEAAASALAAAREQARRQQLYIVHVVEPNMPVKSLYPERWRITATVVLATLLAYSIGWLIAAGVREHAA